jgi:Domain of unknown function (DUF4397)
MVNRCSVHHHPPIMAVCGVQRDALSPGIFLSGKVTTVKFRAFKVRALFVSVGLAVGLGAIGTIVPVPAVAQGTDAQVRVVHFSPDAPAIDVYVDGKVRSKNLAYERASNYIAVAAGDHKFEVRPTGAAADTPAVVAAEVTLIAGKNYTFGAIGKLAAIQGRLYEDDNTPPSAGKVKLRVIHNAADVPAIDVAPKGGAVIVTNVSFPNASPYVELPAGNYEVEVRSTGTPTVLLSSTVVLASGGVYTVAAIGGGDKAPKLRGLIDLAASAAGSTSAGAATTVAAAAETTAAPGTTVASVETTAAEEVAPDTTEPEVNTPPATDEAPTTEAVAVEDTTVETTEAPAQAPDTEPAPVTEAPADTVADSVAPDVAPDATTPAGGAGTGAGGLTGTGGSLTMAGLGAIAAASLGAALLRRRRA